MPDVIVIVPDRSFKNAMEIICQRSASIGASPFTISVHVDPRRDSGVRKYAHDVARAKRTRPPDQERYALVFFDHHGSGCRQAREQCEARVESDLSRVTFGTDVACICVSPELEQWLFWDVDELARVLGLDRNDCSQLAAEAAGKFPGDLEKQFKYVLHKRSRLGFRDVEWRDIFSRVDYARWLTEPSFGKLVGRLRAWFPLDT